MSDHISPADQEKLDQFQIITSFKDEDYDKVVRLLRNNYWNLEVSISKYFDGELEQEEVGVPTPSSTPIEQTQNVQGSMEYGAFHIPPDLLDDRPLQNLQNYSNIGVIPSLVKVSPISNSWKAQPGLIKKRNERYCSFYENPIMFLLLIIPKTITLLLLKIGEFFEYLFPTLPNTIPQEPTSTIFEFESYYEKLTKDSLGFPVSELDYNETLQLCIDENRLLLLILIKDDDEVSSSKFLKKILNNDLIAEYLKKEATTEQNLTIYIGSVNESQSFEIAKSLKIRSLPIVYLIGNAGSGSSISKSLSILSRIPIKTVNLFKSKLIREIERFKPELTLRRLEQNELIYSRQIKKLQDDAFNESLKKDQLKKEQLQKENDEKIKVENQLKRNELNKKLFLINLYKNYNDRNLDDLTKQNSTTIRIKIPNGDSITEKFSNNDTLFELYSIIQLKLHLNSLSDESRQDFIDSIELITDKIDDGYTFDFTFELISPFPRFVVPIDNDKLLKDVPQLWPNGSVLVEFDEDEE